MTNPVELTVEFEDVEGLRSAWVNFISHGALMTKAYPPPAVGAPVRVRLSLVGSEGVAEVVGEVMQSSASATIVTLTALSSEAQIALAKMGLAEADPDNLLEAAAAQVPPVSAPKRAVQPAEPSPRRTARGPVSQLGSELSEDASSPTPSAASGDLEWAYHLEGRELRAKEQQLPPAVNQGDVADASWRDTLISFYMERLTGIAVIHGFREDRWLFLVQGKPVHFVLQKSHPGESLGDNLELEGCLPRTDWELARNGGESELVVGERLVAEKQISKDSLYAAIHRRTSAITRNLVRANFGDWSFHPTDEIAARLCWPSVDVLEVLLDAERRNIAGYADEEVVRETEPLLSQHVTILEGRAAVLGELPFNDRQREVVGELLPGGWTTKELFVYAEMQEQELLRFLLMLRSLGTIDFIESEGDKSKRNRAERALYVGLRDVLRRGEFEALHCHWTAIDEEVERGYKRILEEFSRERFREVYDDRIDDLITRIEARALELFQQLNTKSGRDKVRKKLVGQSQLIMATDLMGKQGNMAIYKGRLDLARVCFMRVLELAVPGPECSEHTRNARSQLEKDAVRNASSPLGIPLVDMTSAVDKLIKEG